MRYTLRVGVYACAVPACLGFGAPEPASIASLLHLTTASNMKLHLPKQLFTALLTAFTYCTLVTGIAYGALTTTTTKYDAEGNVIPAGDTTTEVADAIVIDTYEGNNNTGINIARSTDVDKIIFNMSSGNTNNWFAGSASQGPLERTFAGDVQIGSLIESSQTGLIINNGNKGNVAVFTGALTGKGLIEKTGAGDGTTVRFEGDTTGFGGVINLSSSNAFTLIFGSEEGSTAPVAAASTSSTTGLAGSGAITFTSANNTLIYNYAAAANAPVYITNSIAVSGGGVSKVKILGGADIVFTGAVTIHELTTTANGGSITFNGTTTLGKTGATNNLLADITVGGNMTLQGNVTNSASLTVTRGATLSITSASATDIGTTTVKNGGVLDLSSNNNGVLTVDYFNSILNADSITTERGGWIKLGGANINNDFVTANATQSLSKNIHVIGNVKFNGKGYNAGSSYHLTVGTGKSFKVDGITKLESKAYLSVQGGDVELGTLLLGHNQGGNPGGLEMSSGSLTLNKIKFNDNNQSNQQATVNTVQITGGALEFTSESALDRGINVSSTISIGGADEDSVTLKATKTAWSLDGAGLTTAPKIGNVTIDADNTKDITLKNVNITGTITNNASLTLGGAITMDGVELSVTIPTSSNGYEQVTGNLSMLTGNGTYTAAAGLTINGNAVTQLSNVGGIVTASSSRYHVINGTANYNTGDTSLDVSSDETSGIVLNGGHLNMQTSLNDKATSGITVQQNATITLNSGVSLSSSALHITGGTVTLAGSGTYDLGSNITTSVSGNSSNWTGTVVISNYTKSKPNIIGLSNTLGNSKSILELNGVTGYFGWDEGSNLATIKLTNRQMGDISYALNLNDGSSSSTMHIDNKIIGDGDMRFTRSNNGTFEITGDLSGWGGKFTDACGNDSTVTLNFFGSGSTAETPRVWFKADSNGGVNRESTQSTLNIQIGNNNTEHSLFNGSISGASKVTTKGAVEFANSVNSGSLEVSDGSTVKVSSSLTADTVKLGVNGENATATITSKESGEKVSMSNVQLSSKGISGAAKDGAKGSVSNAVVQINQLAEDASFTITEMNFSNASISAASGMKVKLEKVKAEQTRLTGGGQFMLYAGPEEMTLAEAAAEGMNRTLTYSAGLGVSGEGTTLTLNLDVINTVAPDQHGVYDISITLNGYGAGYDFSTLGDDIKNLVQFDADSWLGQMLADVEWTMVEKPNDTETASAESTAGVTYYTDQNVGKLVITIHGLNVPEPTTSTLSLLALAALAARRRRR